MLVPGVVAGLTLVGLVLRVLFLADKSLWYDEAWGAFLSALPLGTILRIVAETDFHPPLYWLVLHAWMALFGASEAALRAPGVIAGTASLPLVYVLGARWGGRGVGLLACALAAVSPLLVSSDQEARGYSLLMLLGLVATWVLLRLIYAPNPWLRLVYGVLGALMFYLHYLGAVVLLGQALVWLFHVWRRRDTRAAWGLIATYAIAAILCLPWLFLGLVQVGRVESGGGFGALANASPSERALGLVATAADVFTSLSWGPSLGISTLRGGVLIGTIAAVVYVASAAAGALLALRRGAPLPVIVLAVTIAGAIALQVSGAGHRAARYLAIVAPLYCLILARGALAPRLPAARVALSGVLLAMSLAGLVAWYRAPSLEEWKKAAGEVQASAQPGDGIVFNYSLAQLAFDYYARTDAPRWGFPRLVTATDPPRMGLPEDRLARRIADEGTFAEWFDQSGIPQSGVRRLWLVESHERSGPALREVLERRFRQTRADDYVGVTVRLYEAR